MNNVMLKQIYSNCIRLQKDVEEYKQEILNKIRDGNIPLEERWEFFVKMPMIFFDEKVSSEIPEWNTCGDVERYQKYHILDWFSIGVDYADENFSEEDLRLLKEEILQKGYKVFILDW